MKGNKIKMIDINAL